MGGIRAEVPGGDGHGTTLWVSGMQADRCGDGRVEKGVETKNGSRRDKAGPGDERELGICLSSAS